jgi:hypothetical protein
MQNEFDIVRDVSARLERGGFACMLTGLMAMSPRSAQKLEAVVESGVPPLPPAT